MVDIRKPLRILMYGVIPCLFITFCVMQGVTRARAEAQAPPNRMELLDAARLHADMLEAGQMLDRLNPILARIRNTEERYHVAVMSIGKPPGTALDLVNWDTGEITRPPARASAASPK